jgi:hypothetical protein
MGRLGPTKVAVPFAEFSSIRMNRISLDSCYKSPTNRRDKYQVKVRKRFNLKNNVVVNLSDTILSTSDLLLLNKGLGFAPSHFRTNWQLLNDDILRFERKLQLFYHFENTGDRGDSMPHTDSLFKPKSDWWPRKLNGHITKFTSLLKQEMASLMSTLPKVNLSQQEIDSLKKLKNNSDIIIKPADKGGGICVLNTQDYLTKVNTMLNDTNVYMPQVDHDTDGVKSKADDIISLLHQAGYLEEDQLIYLTNFDARCPIFYGLPKIHKKGIPLRPIVSQTNGPTMMINALVDKYLTVAEKAIPDLFQDTTAFLNLIEKHKSVPPNTLLVTMDVSSLYTNIPHEEGINFVAKAYQETLHLWDSQAPQLRPIPTEDLKILMQFILKNCTFEFNGAYFKQLYGTTMGAKFSVKFANIYMHQWFLHYLPGFNGRKFDFIGRLIDDVFTLWPYSRQELDDLISYMNNAHGSIRFEAEISNNEVHFLDTVVSIENDILHTSVYTKPTDKKQYLHFTSNHPLHVKKAIPYSQGIRFRRNTDRDEVLNIQLKTLENWFVNRNYPRKLVSSQLNRVKLLDRTQTLVYKSKETKKNKFEQVLRGRAFLPLITSFHLNLQFPKFKDTLRRLWQNLVDSSKENFDTFNKEYPMVVFKRGKTLRSALVSSTFKTKVHTNLNNPDANSTLEALESLLQENSEASVSPCNARGCRCCSALTLGSSCFGWASKCSYDIVGKFNCNSKNIIYVISCEFCHKQYVGQTNQSLKNRLNNHRSNINCNIPTAVGLHFNQPGHKISHLKIMPIYLLNTDAKLERLMKEKSFMLLFETFYPKGINFNPEACHG